MVGNHLIKKRCFFYEYALYIRQIGKNLCNKMSVREALRRAAFYCIDKDIMAEALKKRLKKRSYRKVTYEILEYGSDWHLYMEWRDAKRTGKIIGAVDACKELNISQEEALKRIKNHFCFSEVEIEEIMEEYW